MDKIDMDEQQEWVDKSRCYQKDYRKAHLFMRLFTKLPINSIELTTNAVVHAITAYAPKTRYVVGTDARILQTMQNVLPESMNDLAIKVFF
jgi:ribosomal protein S3